jgi:tetratricopeptide (TPR) repeat protein
LRVPLATALVISAVLGAATALSQGQRPGTIPAPRLSEAERARRLQQRDQIRSEVIRLEQAGKLDEAATVAVKELAVTREVQGELHDDVVDSLDYLARLHEFGEDWAAARKALAEVLAIRQRQSDRKDWRIADARRALADLDRRAALDPPQRHRLDEAEQHMQFVSTSYSQGKYAEGIGPCRQALEIRGELLGQDHAKYATSLNDLAALNEAMGDYGKAEPLYRQALEIRKRVLGENHPDYAASLNNLAVLYRDMGDYAKAEPLYRRALEIRKRALGANHPRYAACLNNLAVLYRDMGEWH